MTKYGVIKTVSYDVYAEVEAETERDVYELLDNEAVSFDEPTGSTDEVVDVFFIGDVDEEKEHNA